MKVGAAHLTYCTNIHPGESWAEVRANLAHVVAVKAKVAPAAHFGVGLRLSARAALELSEPGALAELRAFLDAHGLYVFTINGFPHGAFHGTRVKEDVYRPDWLEDERSVYSDRLADLLAELLPAGMGGSVSTVPGCFRERAGGDAPARMAQRIVRHAAYLAELERRTGATIALALEPEPCCFLETIGEAIGFWRGPLREAARARGLDDATLRRHLGLCLDACHAAVEFEELDAALAALRDAELPIHKIQLSAGLQVAPVDAAARAALEPFAEGTYLHQVVARRGDALTRHVDLPDALGAAAPPEAPDDEWRIHFHVPIFRAALGPFAGTQPFLAAVLAAHARAPLTTHLEVETYTWDVLPAEFRGEPVDDAIARELNWVLEQLASNTP